MLETPASLSRLASMPIPRSPRRLLVVAAAISYWLLLFYVTHRPLKPGTWMAEVSRSPWLPHLDKVQHVLAFAVLAALLCAAATSFVTASWRLFVGILVAIGLYAAFDEWSQTLIDYRYADVLDWMADITGATLGVIGFAVASWWWRRDRACPGKAAEAITSPPPSTP